MTDQLADTAIYSPGRTVSEFLDPGLWEACHKVSDDLAPPLPFLHTAPKNLLFHLQEFQAAGNNWIFWVLLSGLIALTFSRFYHERRLKILGSSVYKRSAALQLIRESPVHAHRSFVPLFFIYIITTTLLIQQTATVFSPGADEGILSLLVYLQFLGFYIGFTLLKFFVIWLVGIIFKNVETAREYIQNILIYNLVLGVLLIPLLILVIYIYPIVFLYITGCIVLIVFILRFFRGVKIGLSDPKFTLFHLFLYLCTLEILPLAFAVKFISKYFFS